MSDKTTKQTPGGSRGYWFTTEKGQHLFAKEGETPKEACERYYAERETKEKKLEALRRKVDGGAENENKDKKPEIDTSSIFAKQVDSVLSGADTTSTHIRVTHTPKIFRDLGMPDLPMFITANHIKSIVAPYDKDKHQHGIDKEILYKLPELLADPLMITKSYDGRYVAVTQYKDKQGDTIIAPIKINGLARENKKFLDANIVLSFYGREDFQSYIGGMLLKGNVIYTKKSPQ